MKLDLDADDVRPIVELVVDEVLQRRAEAEQKLDGRLAYTEPEAAALLGLPSHVLRDCRLRGEIKASRAGKRLLYSRDELLKFLRRDA